LAAMLGAGPARRFSERVDWLDLDPRWRTLSATAVRDRLVHGEAVEEWLPEPVARYLRQRGPAFTL
jgi:nicotinic acid mononucleotide adenylyltransferase